MTAVTFTDLRPTSAEPPPRLLAGLPALDRATGGGFVHGTTCLLSGEPGAGKSTLLLQVAAHVAITGDSAAYVTAEEAADQVRARAARLGLADAPVGLAATDDVVAALAELIRGPRSLGRGGFLVVDSIQRMRIEGEGGEPGSPRQGRAAMRLLVAAARSQGWVVVVVCHVIKGGGFAGPKAFEHDADLVVRLTPLRYLAAYRTLSVTKNRYGETSSELLEMTPLGLVSVN